LIETITRLIARRNNRSTVRFKEENWAAAGSLLSKQKALQSLYLGGNAYVADLGPLKGLTALQTLDLDSTHVADLGPLKGLTALQSLDLNSTHVADLGPLKGLTSLKSSASRRSRRSRFSACRSLRMRRRPRRSRAGAAPASARRRARAFRSASAGRSSARSERSKGYRQKASRVADGAPSDPAFSSRSPTATMPTD
jgi:hypothetical protein